MLLAPAGQRGCGGAHRATCEASDILACASARLGRNGGVACAAAGKCDYTAGMSARPASCAATAAAACASVALIFM